MISLNDKTNIQGPKFGLVKSTCIDRNTGCQIQQLFNKWTQFNVTVQNL